MDTNNEPLRRLTELDRLRPYMNLAELARRTGHHRANIKRWWDNNDDLLATAKRRKFREKLLEIMEESHSEIGRLLRGELEPPYDYKHLPLPDEEKTDE